LKLPAEKSSPSFLIRGEDVRYRAIFYEDGPGVDGNFAGTSLAKERKTTGCREVD